MTFEFTVDGLSTDSFDEIFDDLVTSYKAIYGADIDVSQNTPDGQKIAIEAKLVSDLQAFALNIYNQLDPDYATGRIQQIMLKLAGITPNAATKSQVDITITTDRDLTLDSGYIVADTIGQNWVTNSDYTLTTGDNTVTVFSENFGSVSASIGTITEPVTIVLGITGVTNPAAATVGVDEETEQEVRVRRNKSLENPSYSSVGSLFAKLANLTGVTDVVVYENNTSETDTDLDLEPNSIWVVVNGGDVSSIAEIMAKQKTAGTGLKGDVSANYVEVITKPDGSTFTFTHVMLFDRPTEIVLYVQLNVTRLDVSDPIDIDLIKNKIAEKTYNIAENPQANELYFNVYQAGSNFMPTDLQISDDDITYTDGGLDAGNDIIFTISTDNITVTEV